MIYHWPQPVQVMGSWKAQHMYIPRAFHITYVHNNTLIKSLDELARELEGHPPPWLKRDLSLHMVLEKQAQIITIF